MLQVHIPSVGPEAEAPRQSPEKSHMVFRVEVRFRGRRHTVPRRYSEFHALHKRVRRRRRPMDGPLPGSCRPWEAGVRAAGPASATPVTAPFPGGSGPGRQPPCGLPMDPEGQVSAGTVQAPAPTVFTRVHPRIKKLYKVPEFPSKRLPNWRSRGLEQRRQGLEAYIQGILYLNRDVPKELLEFLSLRHFPADPKASSWEALGEFLPSDSSSQLYHRPVIGFRVDPYICISSPEPLPNVVVNGVLQGFYSFSPGAADPQPEAPCHPAPSPPMP